MRHFKPEKLSEFVKKLQNEGKSSAQIRKELAIVDKFFKWALRRNILSQNKYKHLQDRFAEIESTLTDSPKNLASVTIAPQYQRLKERALNEKNPFTRLYLYSLLKVADFRHWLNGILVRGNFSGSINKSHPATPTNFQAALADMEPRHYAAGVFLLILIAALGAGVYTQFFQKPTSPLAFPTNLTKGGRTLSFQGRLTDSLGNPIDTATDIQFKLYNVSTGGTALYATGTCSVTPDQDGVFDSLIGGSGYSPTPPQQVCGTEIPANIFSDWPNIYLGVTVGSDSEATPRQQIANVGYALNSETLQGFPPGTGKSTIPYLNKDGDLLVATSGASIKSLFESASFTIASSNDLVLQSGGPSAGAGDIILQATGSGALRLRTGGSTDTETRIFVDNTGSVGIGNTSPGAMLDVAGNILVNNGGSIDTRSAGTLTIGGTTQTGLVLGRTGQSTKVSNLTTNGPVYTSGGDGTLNSEANLAIARGGTNGSATPTAGAVAYGTGTAYAFSAAGSSGECLKSGGTGSPTWAACASGTISGSGTTNFLSKFTAATVIGDSLLYDNGTNVGIGTTGPDAKLDILATSEQLRLTYTDGSVYSAQTLDSSGNLTIDNTGTKTIIADDLQVNGSDILDSGGTTRITVGSTTTLSNTNLNLTGTTTLTTNSALAWDLVNSQTSALNIESGLLNLDTAGSKIGIGTTTPTSKLHVTGAVTGKALSIFDETGDQVPLTASASGTPVFVVGRTGNLTVAAGGSLDTISAGSLTIGGSTQTGLTLGRSGQVTTVAGTAKVANLTTNGPVYTSGGDGTLNSEANLAIARGGTNGSATPTAGAVAYGTGTAYAFNLAGSSGECLKSGGAGTPTWGACATGSITGSGTTNRLAKFTAATVIGDSGIDDSSNAVAITIDSSEQVGIGNTAPLTKFNVGEYSDTAVSIGLGDDGSAVNYGLAAFNNRLKFIAPTGFRFLTGTAAGTEVVTIDTGGKVGIGNTSPTSLFHVTGAVTGKALSIFDETGDQAPLTASASGTPVFVVGRTGNLTVAAGGSLDTISAGSLTIGGTTQTGLVLGRTGQSTKVANLTTDGPVYTSGGDGTLNSEANLAIARGGTNGSAAPTAGAVAYGTGTAYAFTAQGSSGECLKSAAAGTPTWGSCATGSITGTGTTNFITKFTGTSSVGDSLLFDDGTNVGLGTTTPTSRLHVTGAVTGKALSIFDETGDQNIITASASGTPVFNVGRTGNLTVAAGGSLDTISAGSLTIGGTTQTGLTLGRSGQVTTVAGTAKVTNLTTNGPVYTSGGDGTLNSEANLAIARGGTNGSATPTAGAVAYGTGTAYAFNLAGSSGECLKSGGAGTPTWGSCATGSVTGSGTTNFISKFTSASAVGDSLLFDNGTNVGISTTGPDAKLDILTTAGEQLRLTYTDGSVYSAHTLDSSGNLTIDNTGTKTVVADDFQVTGGDILDSGGTTRITLGATTTLSNTTTTLSGTTTLTASSLATLQTAASVNWGTATTVTFTADNATINGSDASNGDLTLQGTSDSTRTTSYVLLQPTAGNVGIGTTAPGAALDVAGNILVNNGGTIDTRAAGTLTIGGTTQTGLVLGRSGQSTKIANLTTDGPVYTSGGDGTLNSEANLAIARGGTNGSAAPTAGAVAYGTGTAYAFTAQGSSGECLKSAAAGTPTWGSCATGSITGSGTTNFLAKFTGTGSIGNALLFDDGTNVGLGTTTPTSRFHVTGAVTGKALSIFNETGDQNIFVASSSGTAVATIAHSGATNFINATNSTNAFRVQNAAGGELLNIDSSNANIALNGLNNGELQTWATNGNAVTTALRNESSVVANGYVYFIGGDDTSNAVSTVYYAKINADGSTGAWTTNTNALPAVRQNHSSVVANGYVYVIGGSNTVAGAGTQSTVYYAKLNSDGSTGAWSTNVNSLPAARRLHSSVVANGYVYVIGGADTGNTFQSTVYYAKLNPDGSTGPWITNANALTAGTRRHSSVVANGYVYVIGGEQSGPTVLNTTYYGALSSDGSIGSWSTNANNLPAAREDHSSVVANGYVYVIGGQDSSTTQSTVYYGALNSNGAISAFSTNANALTAARQDFAAVIANGYVYALGGSSTAAGSVQSTVYYASTSRLKFGGSLDLVALGGENLSDPGDQSLGNGAGSITAGNAKFIGSLEVQGLASLAQGLVVDKSLTVNGGTSVTGAITGKALSIFNETGDQAPFTASASGVPIFTINQASGTDANGFSFTASTTGNAVAQIAAGTDTNIGYNIDAKGTGVVKIAGTSTGGVEIGGSGTGDVLIAGGSASTGCTVTNSTGDITCSKFIDSAGAGAYYLDPANGSISLNVAGDIQTDTNLVLTGGGSITSGGNNTITVNSGTATTEIIAGSSGGNTSLCVTFSGSTPGSCDGKLDIGTTDPPYTINGKKYATYGLAMTGVKEETTGTVNVDEPVPGIGYRHVVDFANEPDGSDLWLFAKTTNLKENISRLVPLLTPSTNTRVWYMVDEPSMRLIIYSSRPTTVAYRLTAPRFDDHKWANTRSEGGSGHIINDQGFLAGGDLPPSPTELYNVTNEQGVYVVRDSVAHIVQDAGAFSKLTVGTIQAGILAVQQITTNTLSALSANVQTLTASNKIISPIVETDQLNARGITSDSIQTGKITPKDQNVEVDLSSPSDPQAGELAKLIIRGKSGQEVASINAEGDVSARNATLSGTLAAENIKAKDASFSGTITADQVDSQNIRDFRNRLENVVSQTSDLGQQTTSVTQTTTNLSDQVNQIQSLLADLQNQSLPNAGYYQTLPSTVVQGNVDSQNNLILQGYNNVALNNLAVTGNANLANAYVINSLGVGNITVSNGQIATLDSELKISALSTVNFLDGAVIISRDGSLTTKGTLVAQGGIKTNDLKPLTDQDNLNVTLNGNGINDPRFVIRNGSGEVASVDSSGSARFKNLSLDSSLVATNSGAIIAAADNFTRNGIYGTAIETQAESAGLGVIQTNESEIIIYNNNIKDNTLIYLTPTGSVPSGQLTVSQKQSCPANTPSCKPYFKVTVGGTSHPDIRFNWLIIN